MKFHYLLFISVLFSVSLTHTHAQEKEKTPFTFKWDNGFVVENKEEGHKLKFGGRIMVDHAYFWQDEDLDTNVGMLESKSGTEFRRARFYMSGTIYHNVEFKLQVDMANGKTSLKDAFVGIKNIPAIGTVRVGHVKEPFRLDALTSSNYITFMERALPIDFSQERNSGIIVFNDIVKNRLSFQAGAFRNSDGTGNDVTADDGYALTGRVTALLPIAENKNSYAHLGLGYSFRKKDSKEYKVSSRPEAHLGPKYISTGTLENVDNINLLNFEAAVVHGPISFQGEYLLATVNNMDIATFDKYDFSSYYGQISYFLTGESKKYKGSYSGFDKIKPKANFSGKDKGAGAWEIAVRFSHSDLNSQDVFGGEQTDITLGVNWYLNPATRIMLNHVWADVKDAGNASILQARMQIFF